jgi:hypothetical protein
MVEPGMLETCHTEKPFEAVKPGRTSVQRIPSRSRAVCSVSDLYRHSDRGGTCERAVRRCRVLRCAALLRDVLFLAIKGVSAGDIIYFGPFLRMQLGSKYVLLLQNAPKPQGPNASQSRA